MGIYERDLTDRIEKEVVSLLKNEIIENCLIQSLKIAEIIRSNHSKIDSVRWTGYDYSTIGDIEIIENGKYTFYELKNLSNKNSKGTLANITRDAFTKYGIFKNAVPWGTFTKNNGRENLLIRIKNEITKTVCSTIKQKEIEDIGIKIKETPDLAKYKSEIEDFAKFDKIKYIEYLSSLEYDKNALFVFVSNMLSGKTKEAVYNKNLIGKYYTIYSYADGSIKITEFISLDNNVYIDFGEGKNLGCVVIYTIDLNTKKRKDIIRVVFHWKNIFQGIATQCLNIFNMLKDD